MIPFLIKCQGLRQTTQDRTHPVPGQKVSDPAGNRIRAAMATEDINLGKYTLIRGCESSSKSIDKPT